MKPRLFSSKFEQNRKPQIGNSQSQLLPNLQLFIQFFFSGNGFLMYEWTLKISN